MSPRRHLAARYRHLTDLIDLRALPNSVRRPTERALRVLGDLTTVPVCSHLECSQPLDGALLCIHHPRAGIKCSRCAELHRGRRHPDRGALKVLPWPLAIDTGAQHLHPVRLLV